MEFQQSNDRRTGKPIASTITRVQSQPLMSEVISEKPVNGVVLTEAKAMSMVSIMTAFILMSMVNIMITFPSTSFLQKGMN